MTTTTTQKEEEEEEEQHQQQKQKQQQQEQDGDVVLTEPLSIPQTPTTTTTTSTTTTAAPMMLPTTTTTTEGPPVLGAVRFRVGGRVKEKHKSVLYCVAWSDDMHSEPRQEKHDSLPEHAYYRYMATCGGPHVTIYQVEVEPPNDELDASVSSGECGLLKLLQSYIDADGEKGDGGGDEEDFYACIFAGRSEKRPIALREEDTAPYIYNTPAPNPNATSERPTVLRKVVWSHESYRSHADKVWSSTVQWSADGTGPQLLCVAGRNRSIKVIDTARQKLLRTLQGHGDAIHDLQVQPTDEWNILSASADESIRLWTLKTGACIAIFGGHEGHRDAVVSVAWHVSGTRFASSGMDTTVKVWKVTASDKIAVALAESARTARRIRRKRKEDRKRAVAPVIEQFPVFSTSKVHFNCVDSIHFVGDLLLTKSVENAAVLWHADGLDNRVEDVSLSPSHQRSKASRPNHGNKADSGLVYLRIFPYTSGDLWFVRCAVDPLGRWVAVGNICGEVFVWDIGGSTSDPPIAKLQTRDASVVRSLRFSADGHILVACTDSATVCKWDIQYKPKAIQSTTSTNCIANERR